MAGPEAEYGRQVAHDLSRRAFAVTNDDALPLGFYAPAQIVGDARKHGVEVRPVSVNHSRWDCTLEPAEGRFLSLRLGMRMVKGLSNAHEAESVAMHGERPYGNAEELRRRARVPVAALERLAEADALHGLAPNRRAALWAARGLRDDTLPLFAAADRGRMSKQPLRTQLRYPMKLYPISIADMLWFDMEEGPSPVAGLRPINGA